MDKIGIGTMFCGHGMLRTRCKKCNPELAQKRGYAHAVPSVFQSDRNIAFKCNWMDTDYEGPCTPEGRRYNIFVARRIWCTQPQNPCYQLEHGIIDELPEFTCYESRIFRKLEFGAGVNHTGVNRGRGRIIRYITPGKLALFTTREPPMSEAERQIFGFFIIKGDYIDEDGATRVVGEGGTALKIPRECRLRFWDFYSTSSGEVFWGTGLYRYLSDEQVVSYLNAQIDELRERGYEDEALLARRVLERLRR